MKTQRASHHPGAHPWPIYPVDHVVGVVDNRERALEAIDALRKGGIQEQEIDLFVGSSVTQACHAHHTEHAVLRHIADWLSSAFSDDLDYAREYLYEAAHDHDLIMVHVDRAEQVELIRRLLAARGARLLRYYELLTVTDL
jgi:hypothetical protein